LFERQKQGFGVPLGAWLRGPLKDWAAAFLDGSRLRAGGIWKPDAFVTAWDEHLKGTRDHSARLWPVLMFEAWAAGRASGAISRSRMAARDG